MCVSDGVFGAGLADIKFSERSDYSARERFPYHLEIANMDRSIDSTNYYCFRSIEQAKREFKYLNQKRVR